jgi:mono/diheme cytochrome c family protein
MKLSGAIVTLTLLAVDVLAQVAAATENLTYLGFDKDKLSAESKEGLDAIFAGRCFHNGLPLATIRIMEASLARQKSLGYDPSSPEGRFYAFGRLPSPPDRSLGFDKNTPLGESVFVRNKVALFNGNCFSCHAGVVRGQVVAGLGNSHFNLDIVRHSHTRGDNFGPYGVWRFVAKLEDPANKGLVHASQTTEFEQIINQTPLPPVDPMPWWLMKYKTRDYWYADGAPDDAAHFSINFTTPHPRMNEDRAEHVRTVATALAFARETLSPVFPEMLDPKQVALGADLFHGRVSPANTTGFVSCKTCHGIYERKDSAKNLAEPGHWSVRYPHSDKLRNVKTDEAYNNTLQKFAPIVHHQRKLADYYKSQGTPELTPQVALIDQPGYIAPPLVGVWATAPYFHNGSVPTIELVLDSSRRPAIWEREHRDMFAYNMQEVGMKYRVLSQDEYLAGAPPDDSSRTINESVIDHSAVYRTTQFGHGNGGHTFGDHLSTDERRAIIEFLKSLSGPDM